VPRHLLPPDSVPLLGQLPVPPATGKDQAASTGHLLINSSTFCWEANANGQAEQE